MTTAAKYPFTRTAQPEDWFSDQVSFDVLGPKTFRVYGMTFEIGEPNKDMLFADSECESLRKNVIENTPVFMVNDNGDREEQEFYLTRDYDDDFTKERMEKVKYVTESMGFSRSSTDPMEALVQLIANIMLFGTKASLIMAKRRHQRSTRGHFYR